jgi:hypothetical protein
MFRRKWLRASVPAYVLTLTCWVAAAETAFARTVYDSN